MSRLRSKQAAAAVAVRLIKPGMVVGLGTGSTAEQMMLSLSDRISRDGLSIVGVPTSEAIAALAGDLGIPLAEDYPDFPTIDLTLDGADEVDPAGNLVKGGGGALLREKLVALASRQVVIMVDESKHVEHLGSSFAIPVEIVPFGWTHTLSRLEGLGASCALRLAEGQPYRTDGGNFIADCRFDSIEDPAALQRTLKALPGVIESGLFCGIARLVITGTDEGSTRSQTFE
ncbi:MAG: ribose-5-phosphate isomerase RpiA [Armatimonadetes bacterium]|nr:ribose-5-phosphate isomerase RpiA [Armatimonadota bacterium]